MEYDEEHTIRREKHEGILVQIISDELSCNKIINKLLTNTFAMGLDAEWTPIMHRFDKQNYKIGLLQLSTDSNIILIRLNKMNYILPNSLKLLLSNNKILKCGVGMHHDVTKIYTDFGIKTLGVIELNDIYNLSSYVDTACNTKTKSLKALYQLICNKNMNYKTKSITLSHWNSLDDLSIRQIHYAADDAFVAYQIFTKLMQDIHGVIHPSQYIIKCKDYIDSLEVKKNTIKQPKQPKPSITKKSEQSAVERLNPFHHLLIFGFIKLFRNTTDIAPVDIIKLIAKYSEFNYKYWLLCGTNILIDYKTITKINDSYSKHCVYSTRTVNTGIHEWKLKVNHCRSPKKFSIIIGVASDTNCLDKCVSYGNSNYYGYKSDGQKICPPSNYQSRGITKLHTNDIITIHLNLDKLVIYFTNFSNENVKFGYQNIKADNYRLVVRVKAINDCVELLSYQNMNDVDINYNGISFSDASKMEYKRKTKRQY